MLRFQQAINLGIASILVIPAVALQGGGNEGLEQALEDTISALDHLVRIDAKREAGDPAARELILAATESPMAAGPQRDQYLDTLRRDVNILTMKLEGSKENSTPREMINGDLAQPAGPFPGGENTSRLTTGLSDEHRRHLSGIQAPLPGVGASTPKAPIQIEEDGFVVDPVLLGRSYFRAERYTEGAELLALHKTSADAAYWLGRCLEKLERFDEAIEAYERVIEIAGTGYLADRARNDLEFLTWKREFQSRVNQTQQGQ